MDIKIITDEESIEIIGTREPLGLFIVPYEGTIVGLDNSVGEAFVEEFEVLTDCIAWLRGEEDDDVCSCCRTVELEEEIKELKELKDLQTYTNGVQREIYYHYGFDHQLDRLIEESAELIQAICKWKRDNKPDSCVDTLNHLIEELGDVKNIIEQIEMGSDYIKEGISKNIEYKVNREVDRINRRQHNGQYS